MDAQKYTIDIQCDLRLRSMPIYRCFVEGNGTRKLSWMLYGYWTSEEIESVSRCLACYPYAFDSHCRILHKFMNTETMYSLQLGEEHGYSGCLADGISSPILSEMMGVWKIMARARYGESQTEEILICWNTEQINVCA